MMLQSLNHGDCAAVRWRTKINLLYRRGGRMRCLHFSFRGGDPKQIVRSWVSIKCYLFQKIKAGFITSLTITKMVTSSTNTMCRKYAVRCWANQSSEQISSYFYIFVSHTTGVLRSDCHTAGLLRSACHTSGVLRSDCHTAGLLRSVCHIWPVTHLASL